MIGGPLSAELTAVILKRGRWYVGYVPEVPGVNTQARKIKGVRENLREALDLVLEVNREPSKGERSDEPT